MQVSRVFAGFHSGRLDEVQIRRQRNLASLLEMPQSRLSYAQKAQRGSHGTTKRAMEKWRLVDSLPYIFDHVQSLTFAKFQLCPSKCLCPLSRLRTFSICRVLNRPGVRPNSYTTNHVRGSSENLGTSSMLSLGRFKAIGTRFTSIQHA